MSQYCKIAPDHPVHGPYHNTEYGFPVEDEKILFERLSLEIMQAGLSWEIVLKKRAALNTAFASFDVDKVARFGEDQIQLLLKNEKIIRNQLKIRAIIANAIRIQSLRKECGGFAAWLAKAHPLSKPDWVKLFKKEFKFTGGEIVGEFLMSIGYLQGAHHPECPVAQQITALNPPWLQKK